MSKNLKIGALNVAGLKSLNRFPHAVNRINMLDFDILALQEAIECNEKTKKIKNNEKYEYIFNKYTAICYNKKLFTLFNSYSCISGRILKV